MNVFRSVSELPPLSRPVVTIGTFDGVHKGHQRILTRLRELAAEANGTSLIVTFHPHPRSIIQPDADLRMLTTLEERLALLAHYGADAVLVVPFTREFSEISADAYVREFLLQGIRPHTLVIGYDHRFGRDRSGNIALLRQFGEPEGLRIVEIDPQEVDDVAVSSTRIRKALLSGNVQAAEQGLGLPYTLSGVVVKGEQIGRELGYPTANLRVDDASKLIPADGIYTVLVEARGQRFGGMLSIGFRPTFDGKQRSIEVNLFDFAGDLYGEDLRLHFLAYLRGEARFPNRESLIAAMSKDRQNSLAHLEERGGIVGVHAAPAPL
ncbi:MAG: bifunctional riboflavin kinase/FAD synthetase [Bacteroidetes bacterium]|nr:bifunctional riboflavin kinase/FAD synthetase [Bacteroidota bacterium]